MMINNEIREVLSRRISLHPEDDYAIEQCWEQEVKILSKDREETIRFLCAEASDDELAWLSEIFDDLILKTQDTGLLEAIKIRATSVVSSQDRHSVDVGIKGAEEMLL